MKNIPKELALTNEEYQASFERIWAHATRRLAEPNFKHYTDHTIKHSERVIDLAAMLLKMGNIDLTQPERFTLLCAIALHDIGMQTNKYLPECPEIPSGADLEKIRDEHHEYSYQFIIHLPDEEGLLADEGLVEYIAGVARNHRKTNISVEKDVPFGLQNSLRMKILSMIIRLADCLDCTFARVEFCKQSLYQISSEQQAHWLRRYYVQALIIQDGKINLTFRFPPRLNEHTKSLIRRYVIQEIDKAVAELYGLLFEHGIYFNRDENGSVIKHDTVVSNGLEIPTTTAREYMDTESTNSVSPISNSDYEDEIAKVLIVVKAIKVDVDGRHASHVLVRNGKTDWSIDGENVFLFPSIEYPEGDASDAKIKHLISNAFGINIDDFKLDFDMVPVEEVKQNLSTGRMTKYTFYYAILTFAKELHVFSDLDVAINREYCSWQTVMDMREHNATRMANKKVFIELARRYGGPDLAKIKETLMTSITAHSDPYEPVALNYGNLLWTKDQGLFEKVVQSDLLNSVSGIVDFGCGYGPLGQYVIGHLEMHNLQYRGIDHNKSAFDGAKELLKNYPNATIFLKNILDKNWSSAELRSKTANYVFVFKNILHLLKSVKQVFNNLFDHFGKPKHIVVVETVFPTVESLRFSRCLFEILEIEYKHHFFHQKDIYEMLKYYKFSPQEPIYHDQHINIEAWLNKFTNLNEDIKNEARTCIQTAPPDVQEHLKMETKDGKLFNFLRRQEIIHIDLTK